MDKEKESSKKYAPIIITTLSRYEHLKRCIESLKKNALADETELYIGIDYPFKDSHTEGYKKILEYTAELSGFKNVVVVKHSINQGSENNFLYMRDMVYEKYDYYIATEDDNEFSPDFLDFMNKALIKYENNKNVLAISGYRYPFETDIEQKSNGVFRINTYFSGFGYGIWKEKEIKMRELLNLERFKDYFNDRYKMHRLFKDSLNQFCFFVKGMLVYVPDLVDDNGLRSIDLAFGLYMYFENQYMIYPILSKTRNHGFDGSGEHCNYETERKQISSRYYKYSTQPIDTADAIECELAEFSYPKANDDINRFFKIGIGEKYRSVAAYIFSQLFGIESTKRIVTRLKK